MRNPHPTLNPEKAREIILYILQKWPEITQEKLQIMLYFMDFDHYEKYEEHLMGFTWIKHQKENR